MNEGVAGGTLEVCVRVFNPENNQPLSATIDLTIQSLPGTGKSMTSTVVIIVRIKSLLVMDYSIRK